MFANYAAGIFCLNLCCALDQHVAAQVVPSPSSFKKGAPSRPYSDKEVRDSRGVLYRITDDGQFVEAYRGQLRLWKTNAVAVCGDAASIVGEPKIKGISLGPGHLDVVVGKHAFVRINIVTGQASFWGAD